MEAAAILKLVKHGHNSAIFERIRMFLAGALVINRRLNVLIVVC